MKDRIKEIIYKKFNVSFSKSGEDIQLKKLINRESKGIYVDIGCWHPIKASNTYFFSLRGWKGICIDPNPELKQLFSKYRKNDYFVNCGVGNAKGQLKYYKMSDYHSSMNTLDYNFIVENNLENEIKEIIEVPIFRLSEILDRYIDNEEIDFFDVDVEGYDLEVLKTNDWDKYRPKIILVESNLSIEDELNSEMHKYLLNLNYSLLGKSIISRNLGNLYYFDKYKM